MSTFLSYVLLGLSLSAPIGPVNAAQLDKGIRYGFWNAWLLGLGAMAADAAFMLLIYFGSAHFLQTPFMKTFLWTFGCFVLVYTGVESFKKADAIQASKEHQKEAPAKSFAQGFFLTLSNPLSILFWLGIYGSILAKAAETEAPLDLLINSAAIFLGILVWDFTMASLSSSFSKFASGSILTFVSRVAGLALIGFGLYFGMQAFKLLFLTP
ncbi:LysE family transporter [Paenibacillus sp.]|uniref:LysE family transporter n=1 Tax=Paenibacillus sp. TaxID=58172 RepID=UPI002D3B75FB|nr:LysE family transporter [Paenibacillus sp.]HZG57755.1 LysE family transporter [Paenibacillus sp.]